MYSGPPIDEIMHRLLLPDSNFTAGIEDGRFGKGVGLRFKLLADRLANEIGVRDGGCQESR